MIDPKFPVRSGASNSDILKSYLALLCLGKSDFDAIEGFRGNAFFMRTLGLGVVPSSPTLRQRMAIKCLNSLGAETRCSDHFRLPINALRGYMESACQRIEKLGLGDGRLPLQDFLSRHFIKTP